jgi:hypothetical protein
VGSQSRRLLLRSLADALGARLESGVLPRELRPEARRLAMAAWLAASKPDRTAAGRRAIEALGRRIDALLVASEGTSPPPAGVAICRGRAVGKRPLRSLLEGPIVKRLDAIEAAVSTLAFRTRRMVEHARAVAGETTAAKPPPAAAEPAGREGLELVWGDREGG